MGKKDFKKELSALLKEGLELVKAFTEKNRFEFAVGYQAWYTKALGAVRALLPDRLTEFTRLYHDDRGKQLQFDTYGIKDFLIGYSILPFGTQQPDEKPLTHAKLHQQVIILASAESRLDDILADVRGVLQADLFDSEIDASRDLLKAGHLRAAGAVARVVIEGHLQEVCASRGLNVRKKKPVISDYSSALKEAGILDVPNWRWIQRLADLGNLCCHQKDREPTKEEVAELIDGAEKLVKTVS